MHKPPHVYLLSVRCSTDNHLHAFPQPGVYQVVNPLGMPTLLALEGLTMLRQLSIPADSQSASRSVLPHIKFWGCAVYLIYVGSNFSHKTLYSSSPV